MLNRIYSCEAYYDRVKLYLSRTQPRSGRRLSRQRWLTPANARAFVTSLIRQGLFGPQRWSYWKFLLTVAARYRHCIGPAMTLAVMGYHFQVMTQKLSMKAEAPLTPSAIEKRVPAETGAHS